MRLYNGPTDTAEAREYVTEKYDLPDDVGSERLEEAFERHIDTLETALEDGEEWSYIKDEEQRYPRAEPVTLGAGAIGYTASAVSFVNEYSVELFDSVVDLHPEGTTALLGATAVGLTGLSYVQGKASARRHEKLDDELDLYREALGELQA